MRLASAIQRVGKHSERAGRPGNDQNKPVLGRDLAAANSSDPGGDDRLERGVPAEAVLALQPGGCSVAEPALQIFRRIVGLGRDQHGLPSCGVKQPRNRKTTKPIGDQVCADARPMRTAQLVSGTTKRLRLCFGRT
jgi:hypothetical protein